MMFRKSMNSAAQKLPLEAPQAARAAARGFDDLYSKYFDFVWRSLRRLGVPPALVEDATQDSFVVVHRRISDLRPDASEKAWLFGIAMRVARDYRRTQRRKGAQSFDADTATSHDAGPFDRTAKAEAARVLERFLASVDDEKRAVFVMAELEGMTAPEISEALDTNLNTVYSRLRGARERFVAFLNVEGGRHG
jgi:RNA polymerase sigma-70 factor (ECF subfamily)